MLIFPTILSLSLNSSSEVNSFIYPGSSPITFENKFNSKFSIIDSSIFLKLLLYLYSSTDILILISFSTPVEIMKYIF